MKRYIVFMFLIHGADGGWDDVLTANRHEENETPLSFDTVEDAIKVSTQDPDLFEITIIQVVDLHEGKVVFQSSARKIKEGIPPDIG